MMKDMNILERSVETNTIKIEARKVQVYYGTNHALKDVDVDILDKTVTAFIGMIVGLVVLKDTGELTALNSFTLGYMANSAVDILGKKSALGGDKT